MRARRLGGVTDLKERNRVSRIADDQYRWNGFLSIVIGSCPQVHSNVQQMSKLRMSGKIQKRLGEFDRQVV